MNILRRRAAVIPILICSAILFTGVLFAGVLSGAVLSDDKKPESTRAVDLMWAVKIPMRDGVRLNATVYRPHEQKDPLPVIFELTPYISDSYNDRATYFARHGYVFAIVDVRGRGNSEGKFDPFFRNHKMASISWNGSPNRRGRMARSRCGAVPMPASTSG